MKVLRLEVGPLTTNAYLVIDRAARTGFIIDPGGGAERIVSRCRSEELEPRFIVNTHAHADHIAANRELCRAFPEADLCIGSSEAPALRDGAQNLADAFGLSAESPPPDILLEEGQCLEAGDIRLEVLDTPGHTPGSISLLSREEEPPQLFCGDLLFRRGVGRVDLPGGDVDALRDSIRRKVYALPDSTEVWPGHGPKTTVGQEKRHNPFLTASQRP